MTLRGVVVDGGTHAADPVVVAAVLERALQHAEAQLQEHARRHGAERHLADAHRILRVGGLHVGAAIYCSVSSFRHSSSIFWLKSFAVCRYSKASSTGIVERIWSAIEMSAIAWAALVA